jgi:hypothetical protein
LVTNNHYSSNSSLFIGQREKFSLGLKAKRAFPPYLEGELNCKGFLMHDEEVFFPQFRKEQDYRGFSVGIKLTGKF